MGAIEGGTMAKKKGRPKTSGRADVTVKMDAAIVAKAKMVASARNVTLAEFLSELTRGMVDREFAKEMKRLAGTGGEQ